MLWITWFGRAQAHPSADEQYAAALAQGASETAEGPSGWLLRVRALTEEGRRDEALVALQRARSAGADPVDLALARALVVAPAQPRLAIDELGAVLAARPDHGGALAERARLYARVGDSELAIADLARLGGGATVDDVLLLVRLLTDAGRAEEALAAADAGPPVPALVVAAVRLEVSLGRPEAALGRIDAMPRTAFWDALRAEVEP